MLIYVGSSFQPVLLDPGRWRESITFALAGLGFVVTMLVKASTPRHRHEVADRQRLDVLAAQAAVTLAIGWVTDHVG